LDPRVDIGHVHLKVADIDRALDFYHGVLGFDVVQRSPPPRGTTGLYHVAIRYPDRQTLADALRRVLAAGIPLDGATDHGVSEAIYLRDPDGNGIELYRDRPREEWPRPAEGEGVAMFNAPFDLQALLAEPEPA